MGNKKALCTPIKRKNKDRASPLLKEEEKVKINATKKATEYKKFLLQSSLRG